MEFPLFKVFEYEELVENACFDTALECNYFKIGKEATDKKDRRWHYCFHPTRTDKYRLAQCTFTSTGVCEVTKHAFGLPPTFEDTETEQMRKGQKE